MVETPQLVDHCLSIMRSRLGFVSLRLKRAATAAIRDAETVDPSMRDADIEFVAENVLLQFQHAGRYVVFEEYEEIRDGQEHYVLKVLFSSDDWDTVCDFRDRTGTKVTAEFQPIP